MVVEESVAMFPSDATGSSTGASSSTGSTMFCIRHSIFMFWITGYKKNQQNVIVGPLVLSSSTFTIYQNQVERKLRHLYTLSILKIGTDCILLGGQSEKEARIETREHQRLYDFYFHSHILIRNQTYKFSLSFSFNHRIFHEPNAHYVHCYQL